jgi:D-serine deaminase-like pyridoxal phosphate-dependent protein
MVNQLRGGERMILMTMQKMFAGEFPWDERYRLANEQAVLTPALVVYPEIIASNIDCLLRLLEGDPDRWRVHIKTAKLGYTLRLLIERGVRNFKCATTLELLVASETGADDVLVAYPMMGRNARRVREIAEQFPKVRISILAENAEQVRQWAGSGVGVFLDINPGMNRTGIEQHRTEEALRLARTATEAGTEFRGLHYYDGQYGGLSEPERTLAAHSGYEQLVSMAGELEQAGIRVPEVITAGTPTLECSLAFEGFRGRTFVHRVSPGTVVYGDATSMAQLPPRWGLRPAVLVLAQVVSHPSAGRLTCDAGHKAVSADAGVPTCVALGHPQLTALSPSEEHLPFAVEDGRSRPPVGQLLYLLPRHVCPTVNNFDSALAVRDGTIRSVEKVSARGHEAPLEQNVEAAAPLGTGCA